MSLSNIWYFCLASFAKILLLSYPFTLINANAYDNPKNNVLCTDFLGGHHVCQSTRMTRPDGGASATRAQGGHGVFD